jgi:4-hydroxy-tetrahydrodipicolinate reductase
MKNNVKVAIFGFGAMGSGVAKMLSTKQGVEITGALTLPSDPNCGKTISEVMGIKSPATDNAVIQSDVNAVLDKSKVDICILATDSFTAKALPKLKMIAEAGINCITTAEEMAYP